MPCHAILHEQVDIERGKVVTIMSDTSASDVPEGKRVTQVRTWGWSRTRKEGGGTTGAALFHDMHNAGDA